MLTIVERCPLRMKMVLMSEIYFCRNWVVKARNLCSPENAKEFCLDNLEEELSTLEKEFSQDFQEVGFCHNDLQYGNIMIDEKTRSITIIVSFVLDIHIDKLCCF